MAAQDLNPKGDPVRIPDVLVAKVFEPLWDLYEGSERLRVYRKLRRRQFGPRAELETRRSARLRIVAAHAAARSPFWRARFAKAGIDPAQVRGIADLASLPLLTKADVREHLDDLIAPGHGGGELVAARTGGSTGTALLVYCDRRGVQRRAGAALLADTWSGWRLGGPVAAVWGNPHAPSTWKGRLRRLLKDRSIQLDTMKLDGPAVEEFADRWRSLRPTLLYGHAHSIYLLATMLRERGIRLRPEGVVATSMMLLDHERKVIEEVFDVPATNRYGCEEVSLIACECERHAGLHLNEEHVWVEVLRDDGSPCAPGEDGRIVVTDLTNFGMPMLRYEVGDRGVLAAEPCPCGRPTALLAAVTGRVADFLVAEDGSRVAGISLIENTLTRLPGLEQMQIVQTRRDVVDVNLVEGEGYAGDTERDLVAALRDALGAGVDVRLHPVDAIAREPSGKYRFSICRIAGGDSDV